jgi:aspartate/methionine/tyrosine aminotransferase
LADAGFVHFAKHQPRLFDLYRYTIVCYSISKDFGLPGLRVGCAIVNPQIPGWRKAVGRFGDADSRLGFFGANRITQHFLGECYRQSSPPTLLNRSVLAKASAALSLALSPWVKCGQFRRLRRRRNQFHGLGYFAFVPTSLWPSDDTVKAALKKYGFALEQTVSGDIYHWSPDYMRITICREPKNEREEEEKEKEEEEEEEEAVDESGC